MKIMKKFNINLKLSLIYKLLSTLFCSMGLLYQFSQQLSQYFSDKTVVNIEIKRELYDNFPAITLCFPGLVSFESIANYDQQYQQDYEYYQQLMKTYYVNSSLYDESNINITFAYVKAYSIINKILYEPNFLHLVIDNLSIPYSQNNLLMSIEGTLPGI